MPIINSGRHLNPRPNMVYETLRYMPPGLLIDVGAAAGGFTKVMAARSPESSIVAFEPFPGNWPLLEKASAPLPHVTVDRRAASDRNGEGRLFVSQVVSGHEKGWAGKEGYSSAGTLVDSDDSRFGAGLEVETVRLDEVFHETVRFLKIDVQGGEPAVLRGAEGIVNGPGIDFMWVEFSGDQAVLDYVHEHGYVVFDSQYLLVPRTTSPNDDEWKVLGTKNLSNGKEAFLAWPREYPRSPENYCAWFREKRAEFIIQTDLTVVRKSFLATYLAAAAAAIA